MLKYFQCIVWPWPKVKVRPCEKWVWGSCS